VDEKEGRGVKDGGSRETGKWGRGAACKVWGGVGK